MDFAPSARAQALRERMDAFVERYLLPHNPAWHRAVQEGTYPPPFMEEIGRASCRERV